MVPPPLDHNLFEVTVALQKERGKRSHFGVLADLLTIFTQIV